MLFMLTFGDEENAEEVGLIGADDFVLLIESKDEEEADLETETIKDVFILKRICEMQSEIKVKR